MTLHDGEKFLIPLISARTIKSLPFSPKPSLPSPSPHAYGSGFYSCEVQQWSPYPSSLTISEHLFNEGSYWIKWRKFDIQGSKRLSLRCSNLMIIGWCIRYVWLWSQSTVSDRRQKRLLPKFARWNALGNSFASRIRWSLSTIWQWYRLWIWFTHPWDNLCGIFKNLCYMPMNEAIRLIVVDDISRMQKFS